MSSSELGSYGPLLRFAEKLGESLHKSGIYNTKTQFQGTAIAMHCITAGQQLLHVAQQFHVMGDGKLNLRAEAMIGRILEDGGSHEVICRTPDKVEMAITYRNQTVSASITWEQAKKEVFVYAGKTKEILAKLAANKAGELPLKEAYATPHRRMQQLWARLVSDLSRVVAPHLVCGLYTPTEVADFTGVALPAESASSGLAAIAQSVAAGTGQAAEKTAPTETPADVATEKVVATGLATDPQLKLLGELLESLQVSNEALATILKKRGVSAAKDLKTEQAEEIITNLQAKLDATRDELPAEAGSTNLDVNGPITQELEKEIRAKMEQVAQQEGGLELCERVKAKLHSSGLMIAKLTFDQGRKLLQALNGKEVELFFDADLSASVGNDVAA